ncbi:MAG TPA: hypothetical protein VGY99_13360 [Candidatus Binataceae bacterium]|jgi:hypothetical protein|nr:hypothetical protein [Candidatus Binataceae bacterium]
MISNQEQLDQAVKRLGRMYSALASSRTDLSSRNFKTFALMAEGPLNQIRQLEAEIAEYSGAIEARATEADVWIRIDSSESTHAISVLRLCATLNGFRLGILDIATYFAKSDSYAGVKASRLRDACDFRVIASEMGSLRLGLEIHKPDSTAGHNGSNLEDTLVARALASYLEVASIISSSAKSLSRIRPVNHGPELEEALLRAVNRLVPRDGTIELYGRLVVTGPVRLTRDAKLWIDERLDRDAPERSERPQEVPSLPDRGLVIDESVRQKLFQGIPVTVQGELRRVDLDASSILVRHSEGNRDYECRFEPRLLDKVREAIGREVKLHLRAAGPNRPFEPVVVADLELVG